MPVTLDQIDAALGLEKSPASQPDYDFDFNNVVLFPSGEEVDRALTQVTRAGGVDEQTRFQAASAAIGHYLRLMRDPRTAWSEEQAWDAARDWNKTNLSPPWPEERLRREFDALLRKDVQEKGPITPAAHMLAAPARTLDLRKWNARRFIGPAPERKWLVHGVIPKSTAGVFAAVGDAGKSMMALNLAHIVANFPEPQTTPEGLVGVIDTPSFFGGPIMGRGTAIVLTAEDDADEIHRRLENIDPEGFRHRPESRLIVWPALSDGGTAAILTDGPNGPQPTPFWHALKAQLVSFPDLALVVIDPLSHFVLADTNDNMVGAAVMKLMGELAAETGATVLIIHHFSKAATPTSLKNARTAIRGAGAFVDNGRWAIVLWEADESDTADVLKAIGDTRNPKQAGLVYYGGLTKGNAPGAKTLRTLVRDPISGMLNDRTDLLMRLAPSRGDIDALLHAELLAEKERRNGMFRFTSGKTALWDAWGAIIRKHDLPITKDGKGRGKESVTDVFERMRCKGLLVQTADVGKPRWEPVVPPA